MAVQFTNGDSFSLANNAAFNVSTGTVAMWIKTSQGAANIGMWSRADSNSRNGGTIFIASSNGTVTRNLYNGSTEVSGSGAGSKNVRDGNWHQWTWVFNQGSGTVNTWYVDGVSDCTSTTTGAWNWNGQSIIHGRPADAFWTGFQGVMAECAMWNAQLTAGEAKALFTGHRPRLIRPGSLLYYIPVI